MLVEIGRIVIRWARFENHLMTDIMGLLRHPKAAHLAPEKLPVGVTRRLKLWRKLTVAAWADEPSRAASIKELYDLILVAAKRRDVLIHGLCPAAEALSDGKLPLRHFRVTGKGATRSDVEFDVAGLVVLSDTIKRLHEELASFQMTRMLAGDPEKAGPA